MSEFADHWQTLLANWPEGMPREGVVVTVMNESIGFIAFAIDANMIVLHRRAPDSSGARQAIIPFESISYIKITSVTPPKFYAKWGFEGTLPKN